METFLYAACTTFFILHIFLNLIIRDIVCREEFKDTKTMPKFTSVPLFLAVITLWWKPGGHPAENEKTLRLMKVSNYMRIAFIVFTLLALSFS